MTDHQPEEKTSFIAEARRAQILKAAIDTLDEIGFSNVSLAKIAKKAGISTALISYHFKDKNDLMDHALFALVQESTAYVLNRTQTSASPLDRLRAYITASLAYQGTHPKQYAALLEIVFHSRTPDNVPYYKIDDDEEEPVAAELRSILQEGQAAGQFGSFNVSVMVNVIRGAIGEFLFNQHAAAHLDLEAYTNELLAIVENAVRVR